LSFEAPCIQGAKQERQYLTFWHWSGVTPYTSSYEFAGSCVFGKQLAGILSLRPPSFNFLLKKNNEMTMKISDNLIIVI